MSPMGNMSMSQRIDFSIRGSYTVENDRRCYFYWTENYELVFRTPDNKRFGLFQRQTGGLIVDLMPTIFVNLSPSLYSDGEQYQR